jgi:hypothetical protein
MMGMGVSIATTPTANEVPPQQFGVPEQKLPTSARMVGITMETVDTTATIQIA